MEIPLEIWNLFIERGGCTDCASKCDAYSQITDDKCERWRKFLSRDCNMYKEGIISEDVATFLLRVLYPLVDTDQTSLSFEVDGDHYTAVANGWYKEDADLGWHMYSRFGVDVFVYKNNKQEKQ